MQAWVKKNLNNDPYFAADGTVVAWTFFKSNDWKKYGAKKPGPAKNFLFRQVHTIRHCKALSETYRDEAPLGIYFIPFFQKDWPILVVPKAHEGHPFVYGDHISLPYEPDKQNVKLHLTEYVPKGKGKEDPNTRSFGVVQHTFAKLPSPCPFPPAPAPAIMDLDAHRELVVEFLSYAKGIRPSQIKKMGGSPTVTVVETQADVDLSARAIENWDAARFECLCIIGVRTAAGYDVTVTAYDGWGAVGETWARPMLHVSLAEVTPATLFPHVKAWLERGRSFLTTDPAELDRLYGQVMDRDDT
jgi:hypothetical protein